jgi:hypothetical protein
MPVDQFLTVSRRTAIAVTSTPPNFVPIRNATRKTAGANILNVCRRAVAPITHALQRTPGSMA